MEKEISLFREEVEKVKGLSNGQISAMNDIVRACAYAENADYHATYEAFRIAFGLSDSRGEEEPDTSVEPDGPNEPEAILTKISAVYSGGDVAVGTAVTALTGIVVTAHYSDGTSETVTGYTLSGTIAEGSNTITVSYGGKTATFAVTGVDEPNGGNSHDGVSSINWLLKNGTYGTDTTNDSWGSSNSANPLTIINEPDNGYRVCTTAADGLATCNTTSVFACWPLISGKTYNITLANAKSDALYSRLCDISNLPMNPGTEDAMVTVFRNLNESLLKPKK